MFFEFRYLHNQTKQNQLHNRLTKLNSSKSNTHSTSHGAYSNNNYISVDLHPNYNIETKYSVGPLRNFQIFKCIRNEKQTTFHFLTNTAKIVYSPAPLLQQVHGTSIFEVPSQQFVETYRVSIQSFTNGSYRNRYR